MVPQLRPDVCGSQQRPVVEAVSVRPGGCALPRSPPGHPHVQVRDQVPLADAKPAPSTLPRGGAIAQERLRYLGPLRRQASEVTANESGKKGAHCLDAKVRIDFGLP